MKQGIFFSIMALLLSALIILIFSSLLAESFDREALITAAEAEYVDDMVGDLETYIGAQLQISSFLALNSLTESYVAEGNFTGPSAQEEFVQCVRNGTMSSARFTNYCDDNDVGVLDMLQEPTEGVFTRLEEAYPDVTLEASVLDLNFSQITPYELKVTIAMAVNVTHRETRWERVLVTSEDVSLVGLIDPATAGRPYERNIALLSGSGVLGTPGELIVSNQTFFNDFNLISEFVQGGFVYRDSSAPSYFAILNGTLPVTVAPEFDEFGYASIIPGYAASASMYEDNQTSFVTYHRISPLSFTPDQLLRINNTGINTNITFPADYLENMYSTVMTDPNLYSVAGCCDGNGCDPLCS